MSRVKFRQAALAQRVCAVTGRGGGWHAHHVITERHAVLRGGDPHDPRNALRLGFEPHMNHHGRWPIPLTALLDENIEFAYELLGAYAYDYLRRHYTGDDPRVRLA